jgi:hypothetical protein
MSILSKWFKGVSHRNASCYATVIVEAQHPDQKIPKLAKRYGLVAGTMYRYREIREGKVSKTELPHHLSGGRYYDLIQDANRSSTVREKEMKDLIALANKEIKREEKQPTEQPLDFVDPNYPDVTNEVKLTEAEIDRLLAYTKQPRDIAPDYNETPPTEQQQSDNRMSVFFGFMLGVAAMLLFILIERGAM